MAIRSRLLAPSVFALAACSASGADLRVDYAPDFDHKPMTVSVIGAYQGGLLHADTWSDLAGSLAPALGGGTCDAFYSKELDEGAPALASAIDHYTRQNGVSDELLGRIAPAATGDTILLVTLGAHTEKTIVTDSTPTPSPLPGRGGRRTRQAPTHKTAGEINESSFELSASFYSVRSRHLVAQMDMIYPGDTLDAAIRLFTADLQKHFPTTHCVGWKRDVHIDEDAIQALADAQTPPP